MTFPLWVLILAIGIALAFDFINGLHDAANSIATVVATRVLKPEWAVIWAAFFNFIAFVFFDLKVANTIGKGVVQPSIIDASVIMAALMGAILWNVITWYWGLPSSSSHALVGGLAGAGLSKGGAGVLVWSGIQKIGFSIAGSPLFGLMMGFLLMTVTIALVRRVAPARVDGWFRRLQFVSAGLYSLGHGGNDAQKTMGIIGVLLFSSGAMGNEFKIPLWVVLSCHLAMGLGTLVGGWRIVKTMGMKITRLRPVGGFCAETAGAITLFLATGYGIPVSTTHTITGSIMGVGSVSGFSGVKWGVATRILWAWVFTIPAAGLVAAAFYKLFAAMAG